MKGTMVRFPDSHRKYEGFLSVASGGGAGVIVFQEWWGLVDHIKEVCDRFAEEGFTALAPDFYNGERTTAPDQAGKLLMALNISQTEEIVKSAIETLLAHPACTSKTVGVVGFCMGGQLALHAAAMNPDRVSACVDFYGLHPNVHPPLHQLKSPVLGIFAENDAYISLQVVESLSDTLKGLGKKHDFQIYPKTDHAFFNEEYKEHYNAEAAEDAWKKTVAFLSKFVPVVS